MKTGTMCEKYIALKKTISENEKSHKEKQDALKNKLYALEKEIIKSLKNDNLKRADSRSGAVILKKTIHANAKDWEKIYKYILKTKRFFIMQKRLSDTAYRELLDDGENVPGIEKYEKETLSVSFKKGI